MAIQDNLFEVIEKTSEILPYRYYI